MNGIEIGASIADEESMRGKGTERLDGTETCSMTGIDGMEENVSVVIATVVTAANVNASASANVSANVNANVTGRDESARGAQVLRHGKGSQLPIWLMWTRF